MGYFFIENHDFSNSAIFDRNPKVFILVSKEYVHFQVEMTKIWSNFSFSMWNFKNLNFWIFFFRNSQKFTRSKIRSNHWVQWSTVQLRKYVEREFKMRLMIALIKFSRVKFEIFEIFFANFNFLMSRVKHVLIGISMWEFFRAQINIYHWHWYIDSMIQRFFRILDFEIFY